MIDGEWTFVLCQIMKPFRLHFGHKGENRITNGGPVIYFCPDVMQFEDHL